MTDYHPEILLLDAATRDDLYLFGRDPEEQSLFKFCNRAKSSGGESVLRRRMQAPWADGQQIRATQQSLAFISEHRAAFELLPSGYVAMGVDHYTREGLPIVREHNTLEFAMSAFSLWAHDDRFYSRIIKGVELSRRLLKALREFSRALENTEPSGELAPLCREVSKLLALPKLAAIPDDELDMRYWKKLRIDQVYRWHEKQALERLVELVFELDALVAMADITSEHNFVFPEILTGPVRVRAEKLLHPFVPNPVANPLDVDQQRRVLFLTGPNMAGKTTYLRAVATALYFAHLGMGVPATRFEFVPIQRLMTSISLSDNLNDGISYFRAEALRVKAVAEAVAAGLRVVAIMDEPFKGTNVKDAFDASLAILQRFATRKDCLFMVTSHLIELSEQLGTTDNVSFHYFEAQEQQDRLGFDYVLHTGVSSQRLGMRVLEEEGVFRLLDNKNHPQSSSQ